MRLKFAKTAEEIEQENQLAAAHTGAGATDLSGSLDSSGVAAGLQALMAGPPGPSAGVYTYLEDALTPLAEAKTRYSFSGRAARDAVGTGTGRGLCLCSLLHLLTSPYPKFVCACAQTAATTKSRLQISWHRDPR